MKMLTMGTFFVFIGLSMIGCGDTNCIFTAKCEVVATYPIPMQDAGIEPMPLGDGAPCDLDSQCEHNICMPTKNPYGEGYCFSLAMDSCLAIGKPHPIFDQCSSLSKQLLTCGFEYPIENLGPNCIDIATGSFGEHYYCCSKF